MRLGIALIGAVAASLSLSGCGEKNEFSRLQSPDGRFVLTVDYITHILGSHDATVSLQEKQGLAATIASFRNVQKIQASWVGPSDITICEVGEVLTYKRTIVINASDANHLFHIQYGCS